MTRYFTQYWRNDTWEFNRLDGHQGTHLDHTADNRFRRAGVSKRDHVFVVTIQNGKLYLLCRGTVKLVTDQTGAAIQLRTSPDALWDAKDHLIFEKDDFALQDFNRPVPASTLPKLRAHRKEGQQEIKLRASGRPDPQALRGVVEITKESAALLDALISKSTGNRSPTPSSRAGASAGTVTGKHGSPANTDDTSPNDLTEVEFEHRHIEPLLERWGLPYECQYRLRYKRGSVNSYLLVDHLVFLSDAEDRQAFTLFENKRRLADEKAITEARRQARDYARNLFLSSFIIAAPQGLWVYALWQNRDYLIEGPIPIDHLKSLEKPMRDLLLRIHDVYGGAKPPTIEGEDDFRKLVVAVGNARAKGDGEMTRPGQAIHLPQSRARLDNLVMEVVLRQGPIDKVSLIREVRSSWGLKKAGTLVRKAVWDSVGRLCRRKMLRRERKDGTSFVHPYSSGKDS